VAVGDDGEAARSASNRGDEGARSPSASHRISATGPRQDEIRTTFVLPDSSDSASEYIAIVSTFDAAAKELI